MHAPMNFPHTYLTSHFSAPGDARGIPTPAEEEIEKHVILVRGDEVAVHEGEGEDPHLWTLARTGTVFLGTWKDGEVWALDAESSAESARAALPDGTRMRSLREIAPMLEERERSLALSAVGMLTWHRDARYCTRCGSAVHATRDGWSQTCEGGHETFPRTDPAVITLVRDGLDRALLAKNHRFTNGMVSALAGFVEPGEDLEDALKREVHEETGLVVGDLEYFGSQPWPFPRSIMVAFTSRLANGAETDITLQREELASATWFTREELTEALKRGDVRLPPSTSIAHSMITAWRKGELS